MTVLKFPCLCCAPRESRLLSAFAKAPADSNEPGGSSPRIAGGAGTWRGSGRLADAPLAGIWNRSKASSANSMAKEAELQGAEPAANLSHSKEGQGTAVRVPGREKAEEPVPSAATATTGNDPSVAGLSRRSPARLE